MCIHKLIASEHKAVSEYQCAIDELGDQDGRIRRVLEEIMRDEMRHIGALMKVLEWKDESAVQAFAQGIAEAEDA